MKNERSLMSLENLPVLAREKRPTQMALRAMGALIAAKASDQISTQIRKQSSLLDQKIVQEFRNKLEVAEDLIGRLTFHLREIQDRFN